MPENKPLEPPVSAFLRWTTTAFHSYNDFSHITDPNLRRRMALTEIDKVPFSLYHVNAVLVAGAGFFIDAYAVYSLNLILTLLGIVFWSGNDRVDGYGGNHGLLPDSVSTALKMSTIGGMIIGQLLFGTLADIYGRRTMYGVELGVVIFATLGCAISSSSMAISSTAVLIFWRVLTGMGIGGEYPLSSVITAEFAPTRWRGGMIAAVNGMQCIGELCAAIVSLATTSAFRSVYDVSSEAECGVECRMAADRAWRIVVAVGAFPALVALYYRITIPETPRYTFDVEHDIIKADADIEAFVTRRKTGDLDTVQQARIRESAKHGLNIPKASWADFKSYFGQARNWKLFLGVTLCHFFIDFAVYGLSLNSATVLQAIGYARGNTLYEKLRKQAIGVIIISAAGSVPGYLTAILSVDTVGRKPLQLFGFIILVALFCILGFAFHSFSEASRLALYVVIQFVLAAGPSTTTFIIPGEAFPTRYRATAHGVASACGKIGALMSQVASMRIVVNSETDCAESNGACAPQMDRLLQLFALMMLLGACSTLLIPETRGVTLEELGGEAPTSYNAGRNGSIGRIIRHSKWNPFGGGQPAGFNYPRSQAARMAAARQSAAVKRTRTGLEVLEEEESPKHSGNKSWPWKKGEKGSGGAMTPGADAGVIGGSDLEHGSASGLGVPNLETPNWGHGWGRIDRGAPRPRMDSIQLEDVSNLLTEQEASGGAVSPRGAPGDARGQSLDEERRSQ